MILICTRMFPSSIIHKNSKLATIQVSNSMDKLIVQLYNNEKEWTAAICNSNTGRKKSVSCIMPFIQSFKTGRTSQERGYFWETEVVTGKEHRKAFAMLGVFSFLIWVVVTQCDYLVKIYPEIHLRFVHFFMWLSYLNKTLPKILKGQNIYFFLNVKL